MADQADHSEVVAHFVSLTGATPEQATQYLEAHGWDVMPAVDSFYTDEEERKAESRDSAAAPDNYTGPRTLDGRPAPAEASSSSGGRATRRVAAQPKKRGIATLGTLGGGGGGGSHQHDDDDDGSDDYDDDDDDDEGRGNLFAGGEKSGLAVQDPGKPDGGSRKIIGDILAKAKSNASRPEVAAPEAGPSRQAQFRGTGMTLGGEGVESRSIPDPRGPPRPAHAEPQERVLHIWQDGFSIDDGELRRFDDPANMADLAMIRQGRAPLHLMNVQHDAPVDVKLQQHDTPYVPQPKKYRPFGGEGRRLGSPVPGDGSAVPPVAAPAPTSTTTQSAEAGSGSGVDSSQPTLSLRIQLPNGTRLPARFNVTHTLEEVYGFVQGASPETRSRPWVLATTFPNKEHTDRSLVLGDIPEFKKGGTAIVKWV